MNNEAYLELKGAGFLEDALVSYHASRGSDLLYEMEKRLHVHHMDISTRGRDKVAPFFWDYVVYRLYIALAMVKGNKAGLLCIRPVVEGLRDSLADLPAALKTIALKRDMQGSFLVLGPEVENLTADAVKKSFARYEALDREFAADRENGLARCMAASMQHMAARQGETLSASFLSFLMEETKAFMAHIARALSRLTPEAIHAGARKRTRGLAKEGFFSKANCKALYPSLTLLAAMAAGMMFMFA